MALRSLVSQLLPLRLINPRAPEPRLQTKPAGAGKCALSFEFEKRSRHFWLITSRLLAAAIGRRKERQILAITFRL